MQRFIVEYISDYIPGYAKPKPIEIECSCEQDMHDAAAEIRADHELDGTGVTINAWIETTILEKVEV